MPYMKNRHGSVDLINDDRVEEALQQGLVFATDADRNYTSNAKAAQFAVRKVDGFQKGHLGTCRVNVVGNGPSGRKFGGLFTIGVNSRLAEDGSKPDTILALDEVYFAERVPEEYRKTVFFGPRNIDFHRYGGGNEFDLPLQVYNKGHNHLEIEDVNGAIANVHISGIAAVLVARYLTNGPIVLRGFELSGNDAAGVPYMRQLAMWKRCAQFMPSVYLSSSCDGPLREVFPTWIERNTVAGTHWNVVGGGTTARRVLDVLDSSDNTITTNAGLSIIGNPDYYWISDPTAVKTYQDAYTFAELHGTQIITSRDVGTFKTLRNCKRVIPWSDVSRLGRSSGIACALFACSQGAETVSLYGFDGYRDEHKKGIDDAMRAALVMLFADNPKVQFTWHGGAESFLRPRDDVPNVRYL